MNANKKSTANILGITQNSKNVAQFTIKIHTTPLQDLMSVNCTVRWCWAYVSSSTKTRQWFSGHSSGEHFRVTKHTARPSTHFCFSLVLFTHHLMPLSPDMNSNHSWFSFENPPKKWFFYRPSCPCSARLSVRTHR